MNVPRTVFYPQPKVDSAVISFTLKRERNFEFEKRLFELVRSCFRMRRKTLYNNLKDLYDETTIARIYQELGLDDKVRSQQLDLEEFVAMCKLIYY